MGSASPNRRRAVDRSDAESELPSLRLWVPAAAVPRSCQIPKNVHKPTFLDSVDIVDSEVNCVFGSDVDDVRY
jgi:hypothetical protein